MTKKKEPSITKTKDFGSDTGNKALTIDELLGAKSPPGIDENRFLLKLRTSHRLEKILTELNVKAGGVTDDRIANVLGPFSKSQILALCTAKLLTKKDELLVPHNTWKGVSDVLSDVKHDQLVSEEGTSTVSLTESITETAASQLVEPTITHSPKPQRDNSENENRIRSTAPSAIEDVRMPQKSAGNLSDSARARRIPPATSNPLPYGTWAWLAFLGVIVGAFLVYRFGPFQKTNLRGTPGGEVSTRGGPQDWPEYLQAKPFEERSASQSPLLAKVNPILEAYEKGARVISEPDLKLLRILAAPGSASLEARVISTNLLASLALSRSQTDEARRLLDKLLEIVPTDTTTLINRALTYLVSREYKEAKEVTSTALRLCRGQSCWVSRAMLGLIAAEEGRWVESDENFRSALEASRGNMWVMGLWMRSLNSAPKELAKNKSTLLLTESLVLDPDLMIDSPLTAPLATQIFLTEVLRGFRNALSEAPNALTGGQTKYLEFILSRLELNPLASSAQEALDVLKGETSALSQLAASYLEKEDAHFDRAAEIISKTLSRLSGSSIKSSWPWSFAGDIQRTRGLYDQAIIFYEGALSRNPRDVNAVFGLALILRDKKDYKSAYQKIEEAQSLDPDYVPAQLRRDRFDWENHWLSK